MKRFGKISLVLILVVSLLSLSEPAKADTPTLIDDVDRVWIVGYDVNGFSCWSLSSTKRIPMLQVKLANKWITKAKAKLSKNPSLCSDPEYPWVALYNWRVDEFGQNPRPSNSAKDLMARQFIPKNGKDKAYSSAIFVKQVYASNEDRVRDGIKAFQDLIEENSSAPSNTGGISSRFSGCTFKGKKLFGKVQVVDFLPDLKVQVVDFMPDLNVQIVDYLPTTCGKWQFVDFLPDLKIQFVDFLPDLKIKYVDFLPGLR